MPSALLTRLDAVNMMLSSIGTAPVNSLAVPGIRDVAVAALSLDNTQREVLSPGWSFNTDRNFPLPADAGTGYVPVPANALFVDPTDRNKHYVERYDGGVRYLYDTVNHTFEIGETVQCEIIRFQPFEELPQAARQYIATRAARIFQSQVVGSDILWRFTETHEAEALAVLKRLEARQKDLNIFAAPTEENVTILRRRRNAWR